jgi:hypothetical protein
MRLTTLLSVLLLGSLPCSVHAEDRPVTTSKVHKKEQQFEDEVKAEHDRPQKKERAKAAVGRVEDGVREFGRGLQGVMKEAGIGDGPASAPKKTETKPAAKVTTPAAAKKPAKFRPAPPAATPAK